MPGRRNCLHIRAELVKLREKDIRPNAHLTSNADGSDASRNMRYADAFPLIRVRQSETDRTGLSSSTSLAYGHTRLIDRGTRA